MFMICFICKKFCTENNLLQNGIRYHATCLKHLQSDKTPYDDDIEKLKGQIDFIYSNIHGVLKNRNFIEKLFNLIPKGFEHFEKKINLLENEQLRLVDKKKELLAGRKKKLTEVYDYWLTRPPDWNERSNNIRRQIANCVNCDAYKSYKTVLQVHHIVPISEGGDHTSSNLEVLCYECHNSRHHHEINEHYTHNESPHNTNAYASLISKFEEARNSKKYLSFLYRRYGGIKDKHLIKVSEFISKSDGMYVKGFCYLNNDNREFKVKNISKVDVVNQIDYQETPSYFIEEAIKNKLIMHFKYTKRNGDKSIRSFKPIGYEYYKRVKVINGFDYLTNENRNFAPQRMSNIKLVESPEKSVVITGSP